MKSKAIAFLFLIVATTVAAPKEKQPDFEFIEVPGALTTYARGINRAGDISGSYAPANSNEKAFLQKADGTFTTIDVPGSYVTVGWGIDDAARVVGWFVDGFPDPFDVPSGFLYDRGQYTRLEVPGGFGTQAYGVSAAGVVGSFITSSGSIATNHYHGFLYKDGAYTQLDFPGSTGTFAYGIAPNGQVIGFYNDGLNFRGFVWTSGSFSAVNFPDRLTITTALYAINGSGSILGAFWDGSCNFEPFIFSRGKFTLLDLPGSFISGINDSGQVVGIFGTSGKAFVAKASAFAIK